MLEQHGNAGREQRGWEQPARLAGGGAGRGRRALDGGDDTTWREQAGVRGSACRRRCPVAAAPSAGGTGVAAPSAGGAGARGRMGGRGGLEGGAALVVGGGWEAGVALVVGKMTAKE
jgi:hypothetical protein